MSNPLVDFEHLNELAEGDEIFRSELISVYVEDTRRLITELEEFQKNAQYEAASASAHSIKGASANLGAVQVRDIAADLEQRLKTEGDSKIVETLIEKLKAVFSATTAALEASA